MKIVISKEAKIRKKELIEAAMELFREKGFEKTSVDDINKKVGVTKGAFYYHFASKEDLLEEVVTGLSEKTIAITREICYNNSLNPPEKINTIIEKVYQHRIENQKQYKEVFHITESNKNLILTERIWRNVFDKVKESFLHLLHQGIREGHFTTDFPEEVYEVIMVLSDFYRKNLYHLFLDSQNTPEKITAMKRKALFLQRTMEKLLGVKEGVLRVAEHLLTPYTMS
ncbi:MAG: TetR/AcrR family transcriptional regulator [Spirochaetales bacterium]|nr:TetR/AcrR family transcriptional regulator [Spirochaetales bacterium]